MPRRLPLTAAAALAAVAGSWLPSSDAVAQPQHVPPAPASAEPVAPPAPSPAPSPALLAVPEVPIELLRIAPNGITAEQVGTRAAATSFSGRAADESLRAAAARVDAAWASFLPRLTGTARYTRLSDFTPPSFTGGGALVGTNAPDGLLAPGTPLIATRPTFEILPNNYLLQATIVVPISDYFLRITQAYSAATHAENAARYDAVAARARSSADGKVAFYTWLRARSAVVVAVQALGDQRNHLNDARNQFAVGNASRADVLRAETAVAAAELQVERSKNLADLTEKQVRLAVHAADTEVLAPGENLEDVTPPVAGDVKQLTAEATSSRYEVKSIDANAESARKQASVARAGRWPVVSGLGDATYANPNPRRFPASDVWFGTWAAGAQVVWTPNDILTAGAGGSELEARANALEAQRGLLRDGIELELTQAWQSAKEALVALESTKRELASATEAQRVARELFINGRATSTTLTDAETELTRARLDALNANADARIARVRLDHALGRDVKSVAR
jgi:outer membrane protein